MLTDLRLVPSSGIPRVDLARVQRGATVVLHANADRILVLEHDGDDSDHPQYRVTNYWSTDEYSEALHRPAAADVCFSGVAYMFSDAGENMLVTDDHGRIADFYRRAVLS